MRIKNKRQINKSEVSHAILSDGTKITPSTNVSLASILGEKRNVPGRKYSGTTALLTYKDCEYLYLTNGYLANAIDTEAAAIVRNGIEIVPTKTSDKKQLDLILQHNDIELLIHEIARNVDIYGVQFVELYDDPVTGTIRFELLPTIEMDYLRDDMDNVMYDKETGRPAGYIQERADISSSSQTPASSLKRTEPNEIARWEGEDADRIIEFKYSTLGGCIEGISSLQTAALAAIEQGYIRASLADSFIRSMPVAHITIENPSKEDLEEAQDALIGRFTARTFLLTSDRFGIDIKAPNGTIDAFKFLEPALSEMAAAFRQPIELFAATEFTHADDYNERIKEWYEYLKMKQKILASILEHDLFSRIFKNPVKVRFNSPVVMDTSELLKNIGFAMQSNAITQEMALDIIEKAQIFGPYNTKIDELKRKTVNKPTEKSTPTPQEDAPIDPVT